MNRIAYVCACIASMLLSASAAERVWNSSTEANWMDAGVWTTNGVAASAPENTDTATVTNGATVNLTSPALTDTNRLALVQLGGSQRGTLVIGPGGYLPTVGLNIAQNGSNPDVAGRVTVDGGAVHATGSQLIGADNLNNPGRLEIVNGGCYTSTAAFRIYGGSVLVSNATFNASFTSYLGGSSITSVWEIADSTLNTAAIAIGREIGNASGKALRNVLQLRSGQLNVAGDLEVGHTGLGNLIITGVVEQIGGTLTHASGNLRAPITSSAVGIYRLEGGLYTIQNTSDSLFLGGRDGAAKGFLTLTGGVFTNKGASQVGSYARGYGAIDINGGLAVFERTLACGAAASSTGSISLTDGTLALQTASAALNLGNASNALGLATVSGGQLFAPGRTLNIGSAAFGAGVLVQNGGLITNANAFVGAASTASGLMIVSNGDFCLSGALNVGQTNNTGRFEMRGGRVTQAGPATLGVSLGGSGSLVCSGGAITNSGITAGNVLGATGSVQIAGGSIYAAGDVLIGHGTGAVRGGVGMFDMSSGRLFTSTRWVIGSYGWGTAVLSGGEIEAIGPSVNANQNIVVGRDAGTFGSLTMTGGRLLGTNIFVYARDAGCTGLVSISGGDLYVNALTKGGGYGVLTLAGGTLHPYNRNTAFTFSAALTNDIGSGDTGTRFGLSAADKDGAQRTVAATCSLSGNGGLAKRDGGTVTLGGNLAYTGPTVVEAGTLALSNAVASLASALIDIKADALLDVSVDRSTPFRIVGGQALQGAGTVKGDLRLSAAATLSGGTASEPAVLTIDGDLTLDADSQLFFNMAGGLFSSIHVTGNLTLPETLLLTVNGAATTAAEGRPILTWDGELHMPAPTRWTVTGEKNPIAVIRHSEKAVSLSYIRGTLIKLY